MLCQNCGENEANINYKQVINGVKKELHLCENCYKELGLQSLDFNLPMNFSSIFGDFLNEYEEEQFPLMQINENLKCDVCNMTYNEFLDTGKFGCENCYKTFSNKINPLLEKLQGTNSYKGRKALENSNAEVKQDTAKENSKIEELKEKLKQLIKEEKYEEAAKVRDEIKKIDK